MGTYCTHYRKLAPWVGYTPIAELETEACRYLFQLWGLGYSRSFLRGAVSALRALEEMGWLPEFVTGKVWRCAKWSTSQAVARLYGAEELWSSGLSRWRVMTGHGGRCMEWPSYRSPACYGWARQPPSSVEGPKARDWGFTPSSVTHISSGGGWGATAGRGCDGWTVRGPRPRSVPLAHFCLQGSAYLRMVMTTALSGCASAHA